MKFFNHIDAATIEEAVTLLNNHKGKAKLIAGGTDLLGVLKKRILSGYPETVINIKNIPGLNYIREDEKGLKLGALVKLADIIDNPLIKARYNILVETARLIATPQIRNLATIGGNLMQDVRCWYYRYPHELGSRINCLRKGNGTCLALTGDNRYHSIFGCNRIDPIACSDECPANTDIPTYLSLIREGKLDEAAKVVLEVNPIPAITGRICPHFCESRCSRHDYDAPVAIRNIERFIGDYILAHPGVMDQPEPAATGKKIAVIGSGPAGLSAAFYLRMLGHEVTIFENMPEAGGMLTYGIPPYRLPKDLVRKQITTLEKRGIRIRLNTGIGKAIQLDDLIGSFNAVLLACGAWKERISGVPGGQLMLSGIEFLKQANMRDKRAPGRQVAVIGGGNTAIDAARTLVRLGSQPVIIYRRTRAEMPAFQEEVEKAIQEGVQFQFLTLPVAVSTEDHRIVLKCTRMELGEPDESGRPRPLPIPDSEFACEYDAVIRALGGEPDFSLVPEKYLNENGQVTLDPLSSSIGANLFAAGDYVSGPSTVIQAITSGRKVARRIDKFLGGQTSASDQISRGERSPHKFHSSCLERTARGTPPELPLNIKVRNLDVEDTGSLEKSAVVEEANRCFNCGCVAVCPSDMAVALSALGATLKILGSDGYRTVAIDQFYQPFGYDLKAAEIIAEIQIPKPSPNARSKFLKFSLRKPVDFAIVSAASVIACDTGIIREARISLGGVAPAPLRITTAEEALKGKPLNEATADKAAELAVADASPLSMNSYKMNIASNLVKRSIVE